uniref:SDR family NAD(P)-dependent oxidoreductase n=1 Tax=Anaerolinea thermolimosa TaxID=229919 RepID=A0A7C4PJN3_9CHLR
MPEPFVAFVTGADRGLGLALCAGLLESGWRVFAGQYLPDWPDLPRLAEQFPGRLVILPLDVGSEESTLASARETARHTDRVDLLINNAGIITPTNDIPIRQAQDFAGMQAMYNINALGPLRVTHAFMPLTDRSEVKRLCYVSSEAGSINRCQRTSWFGYCMSKAALNMAVKILFNDLRRDGYSFRVYHPGWMRTYMSGTKNMEADLEPEEAARYALKYFLSGITEPSPYDEDQLVMRDYLGNEWPW